MPKGEREFCGSQIADDLEKDQKLPELLITPSSKGILKGITCEKLPLSDNPKEEILAVLTEKYGLIH